MTDIPPLDPYWEQLHVFLRENYGETDRLIVPAPLNRLFPSASVPQDAEDGDFAAVVIHKGDYTAFAPDLLYRALTLWRPIFANEVFVVVGPTDPDQGHSVDQNHVGAIEEIRGWARRHASPALVAAYPGVQVEYAPAEALARMARLIAQDLAKPITGTPFTTVAETAKPFDGSRWFWGDDAAKVAELFCLPELAAMAPNLADQLIDVILSLSPGSIIRRRLGPVELCVEKAIPRDFRILGPFTITFGDLSRGQVRQAVRFNDGRTRPLVCHGPGTLTFTWRGARHEIALADAICASFIEPRGDTVVLRYVASVRRPDDVGRELASVDCTWTLRSGCNALSFDMMLRPAPFVTLRDVVLTSRVDELDELGAFDRVMTSAPSGERSITSADWSEPRAAEEGIVIPCPGISYLGIWEGRSLPGHAVGIHVVGQKSAIDHLRLWHHEGDRLAAVDRAYHCAAVSSRKPFIIGEARLLTAGGYYDTITDYEALVREEPAFDWCQDPSMSYDTGVELNAVATWLFFAARGPACDGVSADRFAMLRAWYDRHLALYLDHVRAGEPHQHERIFVRGLAFVILSLDVMTRCFPDAGYQKTADLLTGLLRDTEVPVIGMPDSGIFSNGPASDPSRPELDSQGAALLALARSACAIGPEASLSAAIERGLLALRVAVPDAATYGNDPLDHETLIIGKDIADMEHIDTGFWTYKLGLALRAFAAIELGCANGKIDLSEGARAHMHKLKMVGHSAALRAAVCRGANIEVLTSFNAGETNSETQPWVAMGLVPSIEQALLGFPMGPGENFRFFQ